MTREYQYTFVDTDLAYLLGALRDGSVYYYSKSRSYYTIFYQKSRFWLEHSIGRRVRDLFGVHYRIDEYKPGHYRLRISNKSLYLLWRDTFSFPPEGATQFTWSVPSSIFNSPLDVKSSYLRAFFDTEGDVSPLSSSTFYLGISQKNKIVLDQLRLLFSDFGIVFSPPRVIDSKSQTYRIVISNRSALSLFVRFIGSEHPVKSSRLNSYFS